MTSAGRGFDVADFLADISHEVRPGRQRPLVVHDEDLRPIPQGAVPNPAPLRIAGALPTTTFELFRQEIPPGGSSDMQRHHHETVHFVIAGEGHSEIERGADENEPEVVAWWTGSFVYTPPWTWHRHFNDSADRPVEFLTIENSRLLDLFGLGRRESAGLVSLAQARAGDQH
ncbi:cupin domain-containing protein [Saccharopolyspora phatthalungensis]|uniref:Gentisate 1,2-dioxygenase n=1 Tax=Saccharopolyspora phatthalungensis TaxID=664693 RepID=A0A840Q369_9PSEU|nr:cupin domain-containing protein [Saccharopolyspora phatthalungensis]MBB5156962.1 gentisate 1,2-dioxygenase [Saccharopolyspora phatthalungensis]